MTTPDWYAADEDDADRTRSDLTVWRDRGQIIATQQARIAQLEAQIAKVQALFAGGPDTACHTVWRDNPSSPGCSAASIECVAVALADLREALS